MIRTSVSWRNVFVTLLAVAPTACMLKPDPDSDGVRDRLNQDPTAQDPTKTGDQTNPGDPTQSGDPTGSVCKVIPIGDATTCSSPDELKKLGYDTCAKAGLELTDLTFGKACATGFITANAVCCVPPPPPPPQPPACFGDYQGGETSCKTTATWKDYAAKACAEKGYVLADYGVSELCGDDSYRYVKYECCSEQPPPPPPDACFASFLGDPTSCKTTETWKDYASKVCEEKGYVLSDFATGESCDKDSFRYVKFSCCPTQPPPPPTTCFGDFQGGDTSCKTTATWKDYAAQACAAKGYVLQDYAVSELCGVDSYRYVKYECCASQPPPTPTECVANKAYEATCQPSDYWSKVALSDCEKQGLSLNSFAAAFECKDSNSFQGATWECCKK